MPFLDIKYPTDDYETLILNLSSVMAYPIDEAKRSEHKDVIFAHADLKAREKCHGTANYSVSGKFIRYNSHDQVLKCQNDSVAKGSVAGYMLCCLYFMHSMNMAPSLEQAKIITCNFIRFDMQEEIDIASSRRPLQEYWNEYKPVSHLWAATLIWSSIPCNIESNKSWLSHEGVGEVLSLSEHFRFFAESTSIGKNDNKKFIFAKDTAWRVPEKCMLPSCDLALGCVDIHFSQSQMAATNTKPR